MAKKDYRIIDHYPARRQRRPARWDIDAAIGVVGIIVVLSVLGAVAQGWV